MELHGTGIWAAGLRHADPARIAEAAAELEALGYTALWFPDGGGDVFGAVERLLAATTTITVATGILNLWMHDAAEVAAAHARLTERYGPRLLLGIGVSHAPLVDGRHGEGTYRRPHAAMVAYLDELDAATPTLARADRVLAALGPRMLALAAERAAGAHPYLVTPEHTALARAELGAGSLLLPEQAVVLTSDPDEARRLGHEHLARYLRLPNYVNNLRRLGFGDHDVTGGGSDRLLEALVAWGGPDAIAERVRAHREAGADHVCVQVLDPSGNAALPLGAWRALAPALTS